MIPPFLIPILGAGLNMLANAALAKGKEWVKEKTGVDLDGNIGEPELDKLRQYEEDNQEELIAIQMQKNALSAEIQKAYIEDIKDARAMQTVALQQSDPLPRRFVYYFAWFWALTSATYLACITFMDVPRANVRFADTILGFLLGTIITTIVNFFFGSSQSSANKDSTIKSALANKYFDGEETE